MELENIILEKKDQIALLTLNHPPVNTFNLSTLKDMEKAVEEVENDSGCRVMIITGGGKKGFSAGFDVSDAANGDEMLVRGHQLWRKIELFPKPVIACLNGFAFGAGCELALCCHFRIMENKAGSKIGLPELNLGMIPAWGGTQRLPRLVGKPKALEMILFSKKVTPEEALEIGLVSQVAQEGMALEDSMALASVIVKRPPIAVAGALKTIGMSLDVGIDEGLRAEMEEMKRIQKSADLIEGFQAFMEGREPEFQGK
ncbi:MAG: enoyl-CoA hydratase-related protein [Desulfobacterales bacterium]|nr:enoyl-CoA hydratase-related protein [Desulfobacterales bacterium]